ncbi:MAG: hypothetical protein IJ695_10580 [Butyrivibrio sp.]|nr:hypothetical protein [Butyrivibrio sp.]
MNVGMFTQSNISSNNIYPVSSALSEYSSVKEESPLYKSISFKDMLDNALREELIRGR